eukprot:SAG22_NODE_13554_length_402_cov_1.257426_1_plen_26_part_10
MARFDAVERRRFVGLRAGGNFSVESS